MHKMYRSHKVWGRPWLSSTFLPQVSSLSFTSNCLTITILLITQTSKLFVSNLLIKNWVNEFQSFSVSKDQVCLAEIVQCFKNIQYGNLSHPGLLCSWPPALIHSSFLSLGDFGGFLEKKMAPDVNRTLSRIGCFPTGTTGPSWQGFQTFDMTSLRAVQEV